mmetsp:Transcript_20361/g.38083  ORF Transcript_20361/g.38083 Transcript_20361/m.38083 type:complete len:871 (-) Transcript_20361:100-2712(-)
MVDRKPGVHYPELHPLPWFHSGSVPVYHYKASDSGLTPKERPIRVRSRHAETRPVPIKEYSNVDELPPVKARFNEFPELKHAPDKCMLVTIEHCDRCEEHGHSTRHDPQKYSYFAANLKSAILARFPVVRILVKPRSSGPDATRRLGAFEVQLFIKDGRESTKTILHSKLESLVWPDVNDVVNKLAQHMPRSNLFVTLYDSLATNIVLKGLRVRVKPKAVALKLRPTSASVKSVKMRPRSASSKPTRPPSASINRSFATKAASAALERTTNDAGSCYFERIPKDIYEIEVLESSEYKSASKTVSLFEEDAGSVNLYIPVTGKTVSCFSLLLRDAEAKHEVAGAKATLQGGNYEYTLNEISRGLYQISVKFGDYILSVEHKGHVPVKRKVSLVQQSTELKEHLQPEKKRFIEVLVIDAVSGEALDALVQVFFEGSKTMHEGMTDSGTFKFQLDQVGLTFFQVSKRGYLDFKRSVQATPGDCSFLLPLMRTNFSPLSLVVLKDPGDDAQLILRDDSEVAKKTEVFNTHGAAVVTSKSKHQWIRIGVQFSLQSAIAAHLYSDLKLLGEFTPPRVSGTYWDIMAIGQKLHIMVGTVSKSIPETHKLHLKDFAQMGQLVLKAESSIEDIFGFTSSETPVVRKGGEAFIHPLILQQLFEAEASSGSVRYLAEGLDTGDGVSLSSLKQCFSLKEFKGDAFSVISLDELAAEIGLRLPEDNEYLYIAEEALDTPLPSGWEYRYDGDSWVYYDNDQEQYSDEHPLLINFRARLIEAKRAKDPPPTLSVKPDEEAKSLVKDTSEAKYSEDFDDRHSPGMSESISDTGFEERIVSHIKDLKNRVGKWAKKGRAEADKEELAKLVEGAKRTLEQMTGLEKKT